MYCVTFQVQHHVQKQISKIPTLKNHARPHADTVQDHNINKRAHCKTGNIIMYLTCHYGNVIIPLQLSGQETCHYIHA